MARRSFRALASTAVAAGLVAGLAAASPADAASGAPSQYVAVSDHASMVFSTANNRYDRSDASGRLEAAYDYGPTYAASTFIWRFTVNPVLCEGATLKGSGATADIYNGNSRVPGTHYSKKGESPCYGFHSTATTAKINDKGRYTLRGMVKFKRGDVNYDLGFTFDFVVTAP